MNIIAFGHRKRTGKDTASRFLASHLRLNGNRGRLEKGSIFHEQKLICYKLYACKGLKHPDHYETETGQIEKEIVLPKLGLSPRDIYIKFSLGTFEISPTTGLDYLLDLCKDVDTLIISDLRRPEEADRVHERGGVVIRIDKPDSPKSSDIVDMAMAAYENWDAVISNDSDLNKLHQEVARVATDLKL